MIFQLLCLHCSVQCTCRSLLHCLLSQSRGRGRTSFRFTKRSIRHPIAAVLERRYVQSETTTWQVPQRQNSSLFDHQSAWSHLFSKSKSMTTGRMLRRSMKVYCTTVKKGVLDINLACLDKQKVVGSSYKIFRETAWKEMLFKGKRVWWHSSCSTNSSAMRPGIVWIFQNRC